MSLCDGASRALRDLCSPFNLRNNNKEAEENYQKDNDDADIRAEAREKTFDSVYDIMMSVLDCKDTYFDEKTANSFHVTVKYFEPEDNTDNAASCSPFFFSPLSAEIIDCFPFNVEEEGTKWFVEALGKCEFGDQPSKKRKISRDASSLVGKLRWLVGGALRIFPDDTKKRYLLNIENWWNLGLCPEVFREDLIDMLNATGYSRNRMFAVYDGYVAVPSSRRINEPHVSVTIEHSYAASDSISRAEVLTILAATMTQLEHKHLGEHYITPVMVVSFMDSLQGRIVMANMTNDGLLIHKSKLYDFRTQEEFDASMPVFTRYMAGYRIGDTRQFR
ncbi:hypothetical protein Plec18167_006762 [Paecilomyces lecythidis]|uniref:Uncharacterized protein n=1 Tax=Paecilomyces lecythidis TaxID=3004212 RepID=A0ABR3X943_9EURO